MKQYIWYVNNKFVKSSEAVIPITDMSVVRGFGVFDFLRTYGGKPFHLKDHIDRLKNSASLIGLSVPYSEKELTDLVMKTLEKNKLPEANIKIVLTGGPTNDGITPLGKPILAVLITSVEVYPEHYYTKGVKIITHPYERTIPQAKTLNYLQAVVTMRDAYKKKAVETLYVDYNGMILEPTRSNIFIFKNDTLITPKDNILIGVTRKVLLSLVRKVFTVQETECSKYDLLSADEAFMTASNKEVMPVVKVDDNAIADGKVGRHTKEVMEIFREYTRKFAG